MPQSALWRVRVNVVPDQQMDQSRVSREGDHMKIFILWALLNSGRWTPMHTLDGLGPCNSIAEKYNNDKELMARAGVVRMVCLPPQVRPGKLHGV